MELLIVLLVEITASGILCVYAYRTDKKHKEIVQRYIDMVDKQFKMVINEFKKLK